jgi:HK97 family phage major capsid protein
MPSLLEAKDKVRELSAKALTFAEDSKLTAAEKRAKLEEIEPEIKTWMDEVSNLEYVEDARKKAFGNTDPADASPEARGEQNVTKSIGEQFVTSESYLSQVSGKGGLKSGRRPDISLDLGFKTTISEGTTASQGPGYSLVSTPQVLPGVLPLLYMPLTIADLIPSGATDTPYMRYLVENSHTNAAATVAEGAAKPEGAEAFTLVDTRLHKIAETFTVTDEMFSDFPFLRAFLDNRGVLDVRQQEEAQLLNGDGTGENLIGLLNRSGLQTSIVKGTAPSVAGDTDMDVIYRQITAIRTSAFVEPNAVVIDPTSWQNVLLTKSSQGIYYAGGPFAPNAESLWGKRVVVTPRIAAGTALVGDFNQAQIFRKGGITVEASNQHASNFTNNLTTLRMEERLMLLVYRPAGFGTVTGL